MFQLSEIYIVLKLKLPEQSINLDKLAKRYKHLQRLLVKSFERANTELPIGLSNSHLLTISKLSFYVRLSHFKWETYIT